MKRALAAALLLAGWHFGDALAIQSKAWLGQHLLERAFHAGRAQGEPIRPWPWSDIAPLARLSVPELGVTRLAVSGLDGTALAWGPGIAFGAAGHVVLAGHRDTHFRFLEALEPGDRLLLETLDRKVGHWRVEAAAVVDARTSALDIDLDADRLTLVTCYPFDATEAGGPLRYVVSLARDAHP